MKQLLVLSGKGGTGKTTLVSSFIELGDFKAFADCDVDAPNLHLISKADNLIEKRDYHGMDKCFIDKDKCISCGLCQRKCRFDAIDIVDDHYTINKYNCEGCGFCQIVCPSDAISFKENVAGEIKIYKDDTFLSTAKLKMGEGNSGLLVTEVKKNLVKSNEEYAIVDGSPGIGCPVIASTVGVNVILIVTEPSLSGLSDLDRVFKSIKHLDAKILVAINKYNINLEKTSEIENFCNDNSIEVVGKIPFEKKYNDFLNSKKTLLESNSLASIEVKNIYNKTIEILRRV